MYKRQSCYGVVGMALSGSKDGIAKLLKRELMDKGVKIKLGENGIDISLYIIVAVSYTHLDVYKRQPQAVYLRRGDAHVGN